MYSGVFSILFTWLFVVFPIFFVKVDIKNETISEVIGRSRLTLFSVTSGLLLGGLSQIFFLYNLILKFKLEDNYLFTVLYLSTCIATLAVAFLPEYKYKRPHAVFVRYYFITFPICMFLMALMLYQKYLLTSTLSFLLILLYAVGNALILFRFKKPTAISEIFSFFILSVWVILMTFC